MRAQQFVVYIILAAALSGCAAPKKYVADEAWKFRLYEGVEKSEIISNAREVVRLIDPDDIDFHATGSGFNATRTQSFFNLGEAGTEIYIYDFSVIGIGDQLQARISVLEKRNTVSTIIPVFANISTKQPNIRYIYDLFFSRLDYMLELKSDWNTCKQALVKIYDEINAGRAEIGRLGICGQTQCPPDLAAKYFGMASFCGRYADDVVPSDIQQQIDEKSIF